MILSIIVSCEVLPDISLTEHNIHFSYKGYIGSDVITAGKLKEPEDMVIYGDNIYIVDCDNHRINKYDINGNFILSWGNTLGPFQGRDDGGFVYPRGIACDASGNVYVLDTQNERVQIFDPNGVFLRKFGKEGTGDGEFNFPKSMTLDNNGNIYIADTNNKRVQKFSNSGEYRTSWKTTDSSEIEYGARYIVFKDNKIYTMNYLGKEAQSYGLDGNDVQHISKEEWNSKIVQYEILEYENKINIFYDNGNNVTINKEDLDITEVNKIITDSNGDIYLLERENFRIRKINKEGDVLTEFGSDINSEGKLHYPHFMDLDNDSNIYIADSFHHTIKVFNKEGLFIRNISKQGQSDEDEFLTFPISVSFSPLSNTIITKGMYGVKEFNLSGIYKRTFLTDMHINGDIEIDNDGNIYLSNTGDVSITKMDKDGTLLKTWGTQGEGEDQFYYPMGMCFDSTNNILITDKLNSKIKTYSGNGNFISSWNHLYKGFVIDIARDTNGNYYILNNQPSNTKPAVIVVDNEFNLLGEFGYRGNGKGEFVEPVSIKVNSDGLVYISDVQRCDIQIFEPAKNNDRAIGSRSFKKEIIIEKEEKKEL